MHELAVGLGGRHPWKSAPPYHAGPGSIRILPASFLSKSELNTLLVDMDLFLIKVSSSEAIRVHSGPVALTVTLFGPVIWLAPHLLAHMKISGVKVSPAEPTR